MSTHEGVLGLLFLSAVLQGDSTLASLAPGGVWRGSADPNVATPYVVVALQAGTDALTVTGVRPLSHLLFQAKAVGPASNTQAIADAAAQLDTLLGGSSGLRNQSVTGGFIGSCYRDGIILLDELVTGEKWVDIGGLYRVDVEQTS